MGKRLTKIYTRTGDDGTTGLGDGLVIHAPNEIGDDIESGAEAEHVRF